MHQARYYSMPVTAPKLSASTPAFKNNAFKARSHSISATAISCRPRNESFTGRFPFVFQLENRIKGSNLWI